MTVTLEPERIVPRVANLSARESKRGGQVVYPMEFDRLSRTVPSTPPLPASTRWFLDRHFWFGALGFAMVAASIAIIGWYWIAPFVVQR